MKLQNILGQVRKYKSLLYTVPLILILCVAAYLRLYRVSEYMTFLGDEGRDVMVVKDIIEGFKFLAHGDIAGAKDKFTLLGPTASVGGFFMGPIYYYFMTPFLWAWNLDPTGPAIMVGLFGVATVWLIYKFAAVSMSRVAGLAAASMYAVSPLVIGYSRSSWNPNVVPFFAVLLIYFLWRVAALGKWKETFCVGVALGIGLQLHYLFLFLFIVSAVWLIVHGRAVKYIRYHIMTFVGFLVGFSLFLLFELRHGFPNIQSIIKFLSTGKDTGFSWINFFATVGDVVYRVFGRLVLRFPQKEIWETIPDWQLAIWDKGTLIFIGLSVLFLFLPLLKLPKKVEKWLRASKDQVLPQQKAFLLMLLWGCSVFILFGLYKRAIYDYYLGIVFPLPFLLFGMLIWRFWQHKLIQIFAVLIWACLLFLNWQGRPFLYEPNRQLAQAQRIAKEAFDKAEGKPFNFALITGHNSDHAYRYFFEVWGNPPVTIEFAEKDPQKKTVTDQLIVICEQIDCQPLGHPLWEIAGFGSAQIVGQWDVPFVRIYRLTHYEKI